MNQYQIAIKMSEQDWTIMTSLAICYEKRKEYSTAIDWELKACAAFPPELEEFKYYYLQKISKWRQELKDVEGAVETAKEAYVLQKESLLAMNTYIEALNAASRYEEIVEFAESLQEEKSEKSGNNYLTELLSGYHTAHDIIGNAALEVGKLDFMRQAIDTAIVSALGKGFIRQAAAERFALANFNFRYADKEDEAMQLWEEIYESVKDKNESIPIWSQLRIYCSDSLAERYFNKATNARDRGEPTDDWVSKLQKLAMHYKGAKKGGYSTNNAASILGAWYHSIGNEKEAKACFKPKMLEAIAMLFDDDPRNDSSGYAALAGILLLAGRRAEAGAAFSIVLAPSDTAKDNNLEYIYGCDGPCNRVSKECEELHFCSVCLNATVFCEKCIGLVRSNKLGYRKCSSGHEFFMAYPIAEKIEDPNMTKINGKTMLIKDWLAELKREWT
jgi:tetratricopeptide (TPR) repeat protein